jgi:ankyrin repeat protein
MEAARFGRKEVVERLLATEKVDINAQDRGGRTALMEATQYGHKEVVEQLLATYKVDTSTYMIRMARRR